MLNPNILKSLKLVDGINSRNNAILVTPVLL